MTNEEIIIELNRELFKVKDELKFQKEESEKYCRWWGEDSTQVKLKDHELKELYNVIQGKDQEICSLKDLRNDAYDAAEDFRTAFECEQEKHQMSIKKLKELNAENSQLSADFEAYKLKLS